MTRSSILNGALLTAEALRNPQTFMRFYSILIIQSSILCAILFYIILLYSILYSVWATTGAPPGTPEGYRGETPWTSNRTPTVPQPRLIEHFTGPPHPRVIPPEGPMKGSPGSPEVISSGVPRGIPQQGGFPRVIPPRIPL